jgi:hypothetical protein
VTADSGSSAIIHWGRSRFRDLPAEVRQRHGLRSARFARFARFAKACLDRSYLVEQEAIIRAALNAILES